MFAKASKLICCLTAVVAGVVPAFAQTKGYPDQTIKIVVPFAPGGGVDAVARLMAERLGSELSVPVIVENRAGASGTVGGGYVQRAESDGYTLLLSSNTHSMAKQVLANAPYDPLKDLQPVALLGTVPVILAVGPKVEAATLKEFITLAKASPRRYKGASFATGSGTLMLEMFRLQAGVDVPIVPYRGVADAVAATTGGETDLVIMDGTSVVPHIKAGRLRGLAVAGGSRLAEIPDVPTSAEAGLPGYKIEFWYGTFTRGGTPRPVVERLNAEINKAVAQPDVQDKLKGMGLQPANRTVDQFVDQHHQEMKDWAEIVKQSGFKPLELAP